MFHVRDQLCMIFFVVFLMKHGTFSKRDSPAATTGNGDASQEEKAGQALFDIVYLMAVKKVEMSFTQRRRRIRNAILNKRDIYADNFDDSNPRNLYHVTVPNDDIVIRENDFENNDHKHEEEQNQTETGSDQHGESHSNFDLHPVVENAPRLEQDASALLAVANGLKTQSMNLQSKAAELEKQAEMLHAHPSGSINNDLKVSTTAEEVKDLKTSTKCCTNGQGPERGGYASNQTLPDGEEKVLTSPSMNETSRKSPPATGILENIYPNDKAIFSQHYVVSIKKKKDKTIKGDTKSLVKQNVKSNRDKTHRQTYKSSNVLKLKARQTHKKHRHRKKNNRMKKSKKTT